MTAPRVLGLDLSITSTGVAFPDGSTETLRPSTEGDARLNEIADYVGVHVGLRACADLVVIEDGLVKSFAAFKLGQVHGAVRTELRRRGVPYVLVSPSTLKAFATGKSQASKADMRVALLKRADLDIDREDEVDAWWLRAAALDAYGHPIVTMPERQRDYLTRVEWPGIRDAIGEAS